MGRRVEVWALGLRCWYFCSGRSGPAACITAAKLMTMKIKTKLNKYMQMWETCMFAVTQVWAPYRSVWFLIWIFNGIYPFFCRPVLPLQFLSCIYFHVIQITYFKSQVTTSSFIPYFYVCVHSKNEFSTIPKRSPLSTIQLLKSVTNDFISQMMLSASSKCIIQIQKRGIISCNSSPLY